MRNPPIILGLIAQGLTMADQERGRIYLTIYQQYGYENRADYLHGLADQYGVDTILVCALADMLGESEDFDGLVNALEEVENG